MLDQYAERWALVTGASSGIGAEFARLLAARGMHLVLVARRTDRLNELAAELHAKHRARCEVISSDLSDPREPAALSDQVAQRGITVELLVNNAGFAVVGEVDKTDTERIDQMLRLNVMTITDLTYRFLPGMLARGHGAILNVSSVAAFQPVAYMAAYAASKSYILNFTEALWAEIRDRGVSLMAVCPGTTRTELFEVAGVPGWLKRRPSHSAEKVARGALACAGKTQAVLHSRLAELPHHHARADGSATRGCQRVDEILSARPQHDPFRPRNRPDGVEPRKSAERPHLLLPTQVF